MSILSKKPRYYDVSHLLKDYPNAHYYVVFGERSNGKTYSAIDYALRQYFKYGEQFAYVRRFGEDIRPKNIGTLMAGHVENGRITELSGGRFSLVNYTSNKFFACNFDEETRKIEMDINPMGFTFDLNSMEHHKGTSYPKITTIIFDEFLSRQGYLPNEFVLFMNTLSTIIRDRSNVRIFMLGNTVNKFCPYFAEMGLKHIKEQKPGTVEIYNYAQTGLSVAVEYCDPMSNRGGKSSDIYFAFDNPQLQMITTGAWEIAIYPHLNVRYKPKDIIFQFFISFDDAILHCEMISTEYSYFMFVHPKTTPIKDEDNDIIYTNRPNERWNYRVGIENQRDKLSLEIRKLIRENKVFYSDNETGEILRNYLLWSIQYNAARGG